MYSSTFTSNEKVPLFFLLIVLFEIILNLNSIFLGVLYSIPSQLHVCYKFDKRSKSTFCFFIQFVDKDGKQTKSRALWYINRGLLLFNINAVSVLWTQMFNLLQQSPLSMIHRRHMKKMLAGWSSWPEFIESYPESSNEHLGTSLFSLYLVHPTSFSINLWHLQYMPILVFCCHWMPHMPPQAMQLSSNTIHLFPLQSMLYPTFKVCLKSQLHSDVFPTYLACHILTPTTAEHQRCLGSVSSCCSLSPLGWVSCLSNQSLSTEVWQSPISPISHSSHSW